LELETFFPVVIDCSQIENHKPHPEMILRALSESGISASQAIYIGDKDTDVLAAERAGVEFIGFNISAKKQFTKYSDLIEVIEK